MSEMSVLNLQEKVTPSHLIPTRQGETGITATVINGPLFILAPPRSFTSVVGTMLGQHPQLHGLPEVHLFSDELIAEWWHRVARSTYPMADGLLRAVAQLCFGEQTETTVKKANGWLRRRSHFSTGLILEMLAAKAHPLILVDKSPSTVHRVEWMQRVYNFFPQAKFIHLLRHPRGHGESVMKYINDRVQYGPVPRWLLYLASFPNPFSGADETRHGAHVVDPQRGWYVLNTNICQFLKSVPDEQKMQIRGEDLLTNPDQGLRRIADWLGLRTDDKAIKEMKHPEHSPYACYGPPGARYGNDAFFLKSPELRPSRAEPQTLDGPLSWRDDGYGFVPEVKELAQQFGYQ
jgi:hypothetical protein